ncbi:aminophospholipid-transporting P-type ATPase [Dacryopinax primogenitus]|uniref:Aminophospholipid-transporting P-type ATPase n=1 Tax=Dacryopinax primogenitus (strain DJM 731) TaxID=1858805 RepID=M5FWM1_DACPD|nr:aminophospholipid-transporting P-type ATPase [Dacryopinax primogenitus]EJU00784.1 aminophospholipid-transporting P-type ATPase [Dacryopinax primogenitus]
MSGDENEPAPVVPPSEGDGQPHAVSPVDDAEEKASSASVSPPAPLDQDAHHIAFSRPEEDEKHQHAAVPVVRPPGVGMRRQLTQEQKELSAAGYAHLQEERAAKAKEKGKGKKELDLEEKQVDIHEHQYTPARVMDEFHTTFALPPLAAGTSIGLSEQEAAARLKRDGPNVLTPPKKKSALRRFFDCLSSLFNVLLIIAGVLEYILLGIDFADNQANEYLGAILIGVAFLNAGIEFYQLQKSEAILASFLAMIPPTCRVVREGKLSSVPAASLVKGDVVLIRMGDKTPADLYIFAATDLKVDNSSLTGESEPQERRCLPEGSTARTVEAENLAFNSTLIVSGEGYGVVLRTGDNTFIGQIASLTGSESGNRSPLAIEIDHFVLIISCIAIITAVIFFAIGIGSVYKGKAAQTVTFAVSVLVAWVPEGLPATVTLLLSIAAKRMANQNVLVKDLQGVETLGALTLLATDKTGTLTRNQMTVTNIWIGLKMYSAFQSNNDAADTLPFDIKASGMRDIINIAVLNSKIKFDRTDVPFDQREILGDATETGLTRFAGRNEPSYDKMREVHEKVFEIPFNSENKWALVIVNMNHVNGQLRVMMKGAPERVLMKCDTYLSADGKSLPLTDDIKKQYDDAYNYMASRGHRVIACAQILLPGDKYPATYHFSKQENNCPVEGYCFVGLVSLEDPPKHGVREAIGTLRSAGIKVMMVTGDHPKTAEAIARKINLIIGDTKESLARKTHRPVDQIYADEVEAVVVHGDRIDSLQPHEWDEILNTREIVFARTSPKHKLEIVKHAQALGHIVGVTGDGVNDSPALKKADLGIAMNISGSDVSKEAANMILLDDNFASTVKGVTEGRLIFANLKRSIQYTVSHSVPEVIPQLLYVVVPIPLPLSAILILVIDLGFELFAALSFAWDPPESEQMMRLQPRKPVTSGSIVRRKQRALRRTKTMHYDEETGDPIPPSWGRKMLMHLQSPFTKSFWLDRLEKSDDEILVDGKLLSYAYLEIGVIEMLGALVAYFVVFYKAGFSPYDLRRAQDAGSGSNPIVYFTAGSPDFVNARGQTLNGAQQYDALAQAQSITYLSIYIAQCFNMFAVKAKFKFPFGRQIISNYWNFAGIFCGACLAMFIIYTPPLHVVFGGSYHLSPLYWLIPAAFGVLVIAWSSIRVMLLRHAIEDATVKPIKGLLMFPTMRTMSIRARQSSSEKRE